MNFMKGLKTFLFGLSLVIIGPLIEYLETFKNTLKTCHIDTVTNVQVCEASGLWISIIGGIIVLLRFLTTTSIFKKNNESK